ncbi:DUF3017 domain-containing protein [Nonomuraea sp. NN258]|uniref:DUF3017 domain-containing protein n=1 Tax=Nonomuraea antri TaxID=2730852 RepID=UPI00156A26CE|nr:DUF3017 domain-containing protein [Nonomuraea antri]NRQ32245.1 DUF3017 domain-containing protein [Nonomuraea antri]
MSQEHSKGERWGPYPLILAGAVIGVLVMILLDPRWGGFVLGGLVMIAAALRFSGFTGQLVVRSKKTDVITLGLFGFILVLTSLLLGNAGLKQLIMSLFAR